ncbi:hypothetical protein Cni_G27137 [Canna indica]|uniref:F-box domain-containing protein n=1 Tax=Canna indica TaxID=4628 RepID=A0AAQ3QR49_9LILI|nr:hypothetical protein Cni_G27137 [Canna indica]
MGQSVSASSSSRPVPPAPPSVDAMPTALDYTEDLPDECLALVFQFLGAAADRKSCSLVCKRWLAVEGRSRLRLSLDARAALIEAAPAIFNRFDAVSQLALRCGRRSDSIDDEALALVAARSPNLASLKLRGCRSVTDAGMTAVARHCPGLRKLSVGSCSFGAKGVDAVLRGCPLLEELSIKRLRGLHDPSATAGLVDGAASLRAVCLKDLYNGQCFAPLIAGSPNLKTLKLIRCSGDWDPLLEDMAARVPGMVEIHLERLQVSDRGLIALSARVDLDFLRLVKTPECTDAGLAAIAEHCPRLRKLHIDGWKAGQIGDDGLAAVARRCAGLQELVLVGVDATIRSLELIASNCGSLERLALCGSDSFGDVEVACIASKCASLKKLCIKACPVSDEGMKALSAGCPKLVKVKVKKCSRVTPESAERLEASREGKLTVSLEAAEDESVMEQQQEEGIIVLEEIGMMENSTVAVDRGAGSSKGRCTARKRPTGGFFASRRNMVTSAIRKWSHGSSSSSTRGVHA